MVLQTFRKLNRLIFIFFLFLSVGQEVYAQRKIFKPVLNYTSDLVGNFSGGDRRTIQYMGMIDAGFTISTDSARWWKGGLLNVQLISTHGKGITATSLHDLQGICGIEAGNHPLLMRELWFHQQFGKFDVRGGFQNINCDFMNQPFTDSFSGGSYNIFPTLALNYSLPNYPASGLGLSFSYKFDKNWYGITSLFNGRVSAINNTNRYDMRWRFNPGKDGILSITEVKYTSDPAQFPAHMMGLGLVYHNKDFASVKNIHKRYKNNYTFYAFGEHDFYRDAHRTAGVFLQGSYAVRNRNMAYGYLAAGLTMRGFFSHTDTDTAGIGLSQLYYQSMEEDRFKYRMENTIEMFVKYKVNKYLTLKPTLYTIISSRKTTVTAAMLELGIIVF